MNYNVNKAGMEKVDKEKVQQVIAENTSVRYSAFSEKQKRRVEQRQQEIRTVISATTESQWRNAEKQMDLLLTRLEASRDLDRHCILVDMDAFFAAVEMRDEPSYRCIPMAVGSTSMLGTSNYLARKFGVRAAMPGFIAKKLCPELEIVPGDYAKYSRESKVFAAVFSEYDSEMSMGSLDEAYIDITEYLRNRTEHRNLSRIRYGGECICRLPRASEDIDRCQQTIESCLKCRKQRILFEDKVEFGVSRAEVVRELRFRVEQATGLTCSAGIAANFMLAKICSDMNKPNGQYDLANEYYAIMEFLKDLPIRKVSGIGAVSEAHLAACEIFTVGDLLEKRSRLRLVFSELQQESLLRVGLGLSGRPSSNTDSLRKSISVERTFTPTSDVSILRELLQQICVELHRDIQKSEIEGAKCVTVKLKLSTFDVLTRSQTLSKFVNSLEDITTASHEILSKELGKEFRLLGVRLSHFKRGSNEQRAKGNRVIDYFNSNKRKQMESETDDDEMVLVDNISGEPGPSAEEEKLTEGNQQINETDIVSCPICNCRLKNVDDVVNSHLDVCLNSSLLSQPSQTVAKRRKISDFFFTTSIS